MKDEEKKPVTDTCNAEIRNRHLFTFKNSSCTWGENADECFCLLSHGHLVSNLNWELKENLGQNFKTFVKFLIINC